MRPVRPTRPTQGAPRQAEGAADGSQRVIAVLGMHRSGTSNLAGSLEACGLYLGPVSEGAKWNRKGNRESWDLMKIHEDVLLNSEGAWHLPPERIEWSPAHRKRLRMFIESRAAEPLWGFKDPRALLLLDGWLEEIPDLEMVATFRHPISVARSLRGRHGTTDIERWLDLWLAYDRPLLDLCESGDVSLIDFDLPADEYVEQLERLVASLGLRQPDHDDRFFDASLRNQEVPGDVELPDEVERVYARLKAIAREQAAR